MGAEIGPLGWSRLRAVSRNTRRNLRCLSRREAEFALSLATRGGNCAVSRDARRNLRCLSRREVELALVRTASETASEVGTIASPAFYRFYCVSGILLVLLSLGYFTDFTASRVFYRPPLRVLRRPSSRRAQTFGAAARACPRDIPLPSVLAVCPGPRPASSAPDAHRRALPPCQVAHPEPLLRAMQGLEQVSGCQGRVGGPSE